MDKKILYKIVGIITVFVVLIIVVIFVPISIRFSSPYYYLFWYLTVGYVCTFINILLLVIGLILFIIYFIRSRKSIKRKKTLIWIDRLFGGIINIISIIGIGFLIHGYIEELISLGWISNIYSTLMIPLFILAILGMVLLIHGSHLYKNLKSET